MFTVLIVAIVAVGSLVQFDGRDRAIDPQLEVAITNSSSWYVPPSLVANVADSNGVYVVVPDASADDRFAVLRIDASTGVQTASDVALGPESPYRPFTQATVHAQVHGLRFKRPAVHFMTFPAGKGPGVHLVDSATGRIEVVLDEFDAHRPLLSRSAFNSSATLELLSLVSADPNGRWIAALSRNSSGWMLHLFSRPLPRSPK